MMTAAASTWQFVQPWQVQAPDLKVIVRCSVMRSTALRLIQGFLPPVLQRQQQKQGFAEKCLP